MNSFLLWPTSGNITNPDGVGQRVTFVNGPIYWHPNAGAHPVVNHFMMKWGELSWEAGYLGYPTTDEIVLQSSTDNIGRRQEFQGGHVYWHPTRSNLNAVRGAVLSKYLATGAQNGPLGYPKSDEIGLPDGVGRMSSFEFGSIYFTPATGAWPVYGTADPITGRIMGKWAATNYEKGPFGYPVGDEEPFGTSSLKQAFQGGTIAWPNDLTDASDSLGTDWDEYTHDEPSCGDSCGDDRIGLFGPAYLDVPQPASFSTESLPESGVGPEGIVGQEMPRCDTLVPDPTASPDSLTWCQADVPENESPQSRTMDVWDWTTAIQPWCQNHSERQWMGDRHYQCMWRKDISYLKYNQSGATAGEVWYVQEHELRTKWNSNTWQGRSAIHIRQAFGYGASATYGGTVTCSSTSTCQLGGDTGTHSIPVTVGSDIMDYTLQNPAVSGTVNNTAYSQFKFAHAQANPGTIDAPRAQFPVVRCDNIASGSTIGCIVPGAEPILDMTTRPKAAAHAEHIGNAQRSGLPGSPYAGVPLTRTLGTQVQTNRNNTCNRVMTSRPTGQDCDEYPFASTTQGGSITGTRTWNYCAVDLPNIPVLNPVDIGVPSAPGTSMCFISSSANRSGGGILSWFYRKNRIIDGDNFYVKGT